MKKLIYLAVVSALGLPLSALSAGDSKQPGSADPHPNLAAAYQQKCAAYSGEDLEQCLDRIWLRHMRRMSDGTPKGNPVRPVNPPATYDPVNPSRAQ